MSLHFLGIRDFPIVPRQVSSPSSKPPPSPSQSSTQELIQDSKDVLIQRLLDLATHLQEQDLRDEDLSTLHHDVAHMERTWHQTPALPQSPRPLPLPHTHFAHSRTASRAPDTPRSQTPDNDRFWAPLSPGLRSPIRLFDSPSLTSKRAVPPISPKKAALLASEADSLLTQLTRTVAELRARREESEASPPRGRPGRYVTNASTHSISTTS